MSGQPKRRRNPRSERGLSLVETVFAVSLLTVIALGLLPLGVLATVTTENQGHLAARTTEYAQDKLEQLLALAWGDVTTDTRQFPAADAGGSGLAVGGSSDPAAPVDLYVDYLDFDGNRIAGAGAAAPDGWFYKRAWNVAIVAGAPAIKQVTVTTIVKNAVGGWGRIPQSTVSALKTSPF